MFDDVCNVQYGAVVGRNVCMGREEEVGIGTSSSVRFAEVACITV